MICWRAEDQMDNVFGDHIGRRSLCTEDGRDGSSGLMAFFDLQIFGGSGTGRLTAGACTLAKALDLDVKDGIGIDFQSLCFL